MPGLGIADATIWQHEQIRLKREAAPVEPADAASPAGRFWERRRPRQSRLEAQVLEALGRQLMQPGLVEAFIEAFNTAWKRALAQTSRKRRSAQPRDADCGTAHRNLVDALADGVRAPDIQKRLDDLERRRAELATALAAPSAVVPVMPANLAAVYREQLTRLRQALPGPDHTEALEAVRALVDRIVITPPADPGEPPDINLIGDLTSMLKAGGFQTKPSEEMVVSSQIVTMSESSVTGELRALPLDPTNGREALGTHSIMGQAPLAFPTPPLPLPRSRGWPAGRWRPLRRSRARVSRSTRPHRGGRAGTAWRFHGPGRCAGCRS